MSSGRRRSRSFGCCRLPGADSEADPGDSGASIDLTQQFNDPCQKLVVHPVKHKPVGREQTQLMGILIRLERPNPHVELLGRQLFLKSSKTPLPQRISHERSLEIRRPRRIEPAMINAREQTYPQVPQKIFQLKTGMPETAIRANTTRLLKWKSHVKPTRKPVDEAGA